MRRSKPTRWTDSAALATALAVALCASLTGCAGETRAAEPEPVAPRGLTAQASSATSVHVMWNKAATGNIEEYEIYRGTTRVKTVPADRLMVDVTGLKPAATYKFTVRAKAKNGTASPLSRAVTVTTRSRATADSEPPTAPTRLRAHASGPRAATLSWRAATDNEEVTSYDVYQRGSKIHSVDGDSTAALVTGLRPGIDYTFTVKARDAADNSSRAADPVGLTTAAAPEGAEGTSAGTAPADFRVGTHVDDGAHHLDLSWTPPDTGGDVSEYQIHLDGRPATTLMWGAEAPEGRAEHSFFITREAGRTYRVKLRAKLPDGNWGAFSKERTVITGEPGR
ncbi:fibronectin type III domain-containing protein [Streptomyces cavernicola]|uniref:Fibronectin type III domain-containing protein n=1 Tax=Streptomyces cavernicola TaxID=3043613 RepID=A0ABT6S4W9_9ACTN|nr:fibronectin type III domain-containing protein [Streptomyces sp. B-S-A6]MDI3403143.1 fibronectin type III domain-containing protein [Streptomyces sp. B-S-A6]